MAGTLVCLGIHYLHILTLSLSHSLHCLHLNLHYLKLLFLVVLFTVLTLEQEFFFSISVITGFFQISQVVGYIFFQALDLVHKLLG